MWRAPRFWRGENRFALFISWLLIPASWIYAAISYWRMFHVKHYHVSVPVICVGNMIVGGAGKTPTTLFLADRLKARGENIFILTRGYGGSLKGVCQVDRARHNARLVGDEAWMMSAYHPVMIGGDRVAAARLAIEKGASLLLMDDGFQNMSLYKDLSFLVMDDYGLGNGRLLPAGPLREYPKLALARADAVMLLGTDAAALPLHDLPMVAAEIKPKAAASLPQSLVAFTAIAHPEKFWNLLSSAAHAPIETHAFADHYFFQQKDGVFLLARAEKLGAHLITTEKDYARLQSARAPALAMLLEKCYVYPVALFMKEAEEEKLDQLLERIGS